MSLPISKSQIDRLGQRLITCESPADEDLALLEDVLIAYAGVVFEARQMLDALENDVFRNVSITGRAKTTQTTLEKLVRNKSRLSSIEDLAGVRIVADITLSEQDALAERVCELFGGADSCRLIDRRSDPRSGYRAVHVVAKLGGMPLEIQVRTRCQDAWANYYEATADAFGRGIRYGEPARPTGNANLDATIAALVTWTIKRSDFLYEREQVIDMLPIDQRLDLNVLSDGLTEMTQKMRELKGTFQHLTEAGS